MDPSEFENTVEKTENALSAGIFEEFINGVQEKFQPFDILKEAGDIYLALYNCQETLKKFPQSENNEDYFQNLDDNAIKVTEMKEDYIQRRKKLSSSIKKYLHEALPSIASDENENEERRQQLDALRKETNDIIDLFKKEFDHLSTFAKFSESAFLALYKETREYLIESKLAIEQSINLCLSNQEIFKRVADQFRIGEQLLRTHHEHLGSGISSNHTGNGGSGNNNNGVIHNSGAVTNSVTAAIEPINLGLSTGILVSEADKWQQKYQEDLAHELHAMKLQYDTELMELKASFDRQQRSQQLSLQETLETRHSQIQQQLENSLQAKDQEIASLLQSLTTMQAQLVQYTANQEQWENEQRKKQQNEEKVRQLMVELATIEQQIPRLQKEIDLRDQDIRHWQQQATSSQEQFTVQKHQLEVNVEALTRKVHQLEMEISANPPKQLQEFAFQVGYQSSLSFHSQKSDTSVGKEQNQDKDDHVDDNLFSQPYISWKDLEEFIVEKLQRLENDLLLLRRQEQQRITAQSELQQEMEKWRQKSVARDQEVQQLEKDLMVAQQQVLVQQKQRNSNNANPSNSNKKNNKPNVPKLSNPEEEELQELEAALSPTATDAVSNDKTTHQNPNNQDSIIIVQESLVKQRDRLMRTRRELEEQLRQYRQREEHLQEAMDKLTQENVALYERLTNQQSTSQQPNQQQHQTRKLRRSSQSITNNDSESFPNHHSLDLETAAATSNNINSNSLNPSNNNSMQDLDKRYQSLAQEQYLTRLIPGQQWWATLLRALFTDPYTRQAMFLYMFLLHCCAVMYIWQVLTPQLQDEIVAQQKEKWNLQTLSQADLHPDMHE